MYIVCYIFDLVYYRQQIRAYHADGLSIKEKQELMGKIQTTLNLLVVSGKTPTPERKAYLNGLWACYEVLPSYVHRQDPYKSDFPNEDEFDGRSLLKLLGDAVAFFLRDGFDDPQLYYRSEHVFIRLLDGQSKRDLLHSSHIFFST